ncbi:MAG: hypothetical protein HDR88_16845 [Bacteroides sp.]|nr:hypothetical protein [Bacteroides sp.]
MSQDDDKDLQPEAQEEEKKKVKKHLIRPTWLRITLKTLMWIIIAVLLIPVLLYVPPVQTFVKNIACDEVKKSTGMDISIGTFRLKWPLDVLLKDVTVLEATGDTMVNAREVIANVKMAPLLKMDVDINELKLIDGYYRMVSPDSSMILKVRAALLEVDDESSANIKTGEINLNKARLQNGDLALLMDVWKQQSTPKDSTAVPFVIKANDLKIDNFTFGMSMLPTIDTLMLATSSIVLRNGVIDLEKNMVTADYLGTSDGDVTYITPTLEYVQTHPAPAPDTTAVASPPMIIKGDTVELNSYKAIYTMKGAKPLPGFDPSYIEVTDVGITLNNFYNAASTVELPITRIAAKERSGLQIMEGHGTVSVDSTGLALRDLSVKTPWSDLQATAGLPFALMEMQPSAPLDVKAFGNIGLPDVEAFMPTLSTYTTKLPRRDPLSFDLEAAGKLDDVDISRLEAGMNGVFALSAKGKAQNALDFKRLRANLTFDGSVSNPGVIDNILGNVGFKMPSLKLTGRASVAEQTYAADFTLRTSVGDVAADGKVSMTAESYNANVNLRNVNVAHFAPTTGVGLVTASLNAAGAGFDPTKARAYTDVLIDVKSLVYGKQLLHDIKADVTLKDGVYHLSANSNNPDALLSLDATGTIAPDLYTFDVRGYLDNIDLYSLGITPDVNKGKGEIYVEGSASPGKWLYDVAMKLNKVEWTLGNQYFSVPGALTLDFKSAGNFVDANLNALMTRLSFHSGSGLKPLIDSFSLVGESVIRQIKNRDLDVEGLQHNLPSFMLGVNASGRGLVGQYLNTMGMRVDTIYGKVANDSLISGKIEALSIANTSMRVDTASLSLMQRGKLLDYQVHMGNRKNNTALAEFADVNLNGYVGSNRVLVSLTQKNQKGETGYRIGMTGAMTDSLVTVHFTPLNATIAYLPWKFNTDNHVDFNFNNKHIDANLLAQSNESSILLQTQLGREGNDELKVKLDNIKVQDFLQLSVFAPPLTASVDADLTVGYTKSWFYGGGDVNVSDFTYDRIRVGDFDLGLRAAHNTDGSTGARASLKIDGKDALAAKMMLRPDSVTGELVAKTMGLELTKFPLYIANAFMGPDVARLSGYLNGDMNMTGSFADPKLTGYLACDSVGVYISMLGSSLTFGNDSITVKDNFLRMKDFDIWGANKNPLVLNGEVDATKLSAISFNLNMDAKNFQLINNSKKTGSDIYGKIFLDMNASARGPIQHFSINANVNVLSATDVTYSVSPTAAALQAQDASDVVKFVNFNDTTQVTAVDSVAPTIAMRIVAGLNIEPGTQVEVVIPGSKNNMETGSGKAELSPSGELSYFQNYMGDMRLNGQLNLGEGYVSYSIPVMGNKKFTFDPNSNVVWNGDVMNPTLNIKATDKVKANLLEGGNSRMVNFFVQLNVENNLSAPKLQFDLSTDDDMSIENELQSMTPEQRSTAAMKLLITGQYSGQGVKTASSDMLQGTLYNYLTSQVNNWLANNVKGVDLSLGVNQYDKTVNGETGSAMTYSYTMSKSLFDNRFKISVGGNYTTDASADENFSENLINDISFEYILRQTTDLTMYARLFRHTGFESILEGEITETGVGFVMKRSLTTLRDLFRWKTPSWMSLRTFGLQRNDSTRSESKEVTLKKDEALKPDSVTVTPIEEEIKDDKK